MSSPNLPRPLVYAHRGGAALRPENTLAAFDHGLALGADGLELDVHLSSDDVVVVHHDRTLDRTTDGRGALRLKTAAELARLDAGYHFVPRAGVPQEASIPAAGGVLPPPEGTDTSVAGPASSEDGAAPFRGRGIGVPTLRQVLERYAVPLIIELKTPEPALARAVVDELRRVDALGRVALGSFYSDAVRAAREYEPRLSTGAAREETRWALYRSWLHLPLRRPRYREFQVPECSGRTRIVTPRFIRHAHAAGVAVKVWTVDTRADVERLLGWGVDGIISDRPDVAVRVRDELWEGVHGVDRGNGS